MSTWKDILLEACAMYELTTELIQENSKQPETDFKKLNETNLKAILVFCNNIIADINEKTARAV